MVRSYVRFQSFFAHLRKELEGALAPIESLILQRRWRNACTLSCSVTSATDTGTPLLRTHIPNRSSRRMSRRTASDVAHTCNDICYLA